MNGFEKKEPDENQPVRLNRYLSDAGVCSRRQADLAIEEGMVTVDGIQAVMGMKVYPGQDIEYRGKKVEREKEYILLAFNKPSGIECTTDTDTPDNIISYINYPKRIYPIGRLDKKSEGLILLTNDGSIVNTILKSCNYHEKEYIVKVNQKITDEFLEKMAGGVDLSDEVTRPCKVKRIDDRNFRIIITQGLNRQIRRMCNALGYGVVRLVRVRIMKLRLGNLKPGMYRKVTPGEVGLKV